MKKKRFYKRSLLAIPGGDVARNAYPCPCENNAIIGCNYLM